MHIMPAELVQRFQEAYGPTTDAVHTFFAPGRVNLIGEHIDYNGGYVFPAALTLGIHAAVQVRKDKVVRVRSANMQGEITYTLDAELAYKAEDSWGNFPKGVMAFLLAEGYKLPGMDVYYWGNLPEASGLSSSACMEVLTTYMCLTLAKAQKIDRVWMSQFTQRVENKFIKVNCGIMDMFAISVGKRDHAILLDCATLKYELVPSAMPGYNLIILNTKKTRELADSKYNERRAECDAALALIQAQHPGVKDLCAATMAQVDECVSDPVLHQRAKHVVTENMRVLKAVEVLKKGDIATFGQLLNASHASLQKDYEVTGIHLDAIVAAAQAHHGCTGARMTGAGFGGCGLAVVSIEHTQDFIDKVSATYNAATGLVGEFYISQVGDGVRAHS